MNADPSRLRAMQCGVCGRPLEHMTDQGWLHTSPDRQDHVPVPVEPWSIPFVLACDFCRADVPFEEAWTVPASDFVAIHGVAHSIANWLACPTCAEDATAHRWHTLAERAVDSLPPDRFLSRHRGRVLREFLALYRQLEAHMTGPVRPMEKGDVNQ